MKSPYLAAAEAVLEYQVENPNATALDLEVIIATAKMEADDRNARSRRIDQLADAVGYGRDFGSHHYH